MQRRVLLAHDDGLFARSIERFLRQDAAENPLPYPLEVVLARTPDEAEERFAAGPQPNLVVAGLRADGSRHDGLALAARIRETSRVPVLLLHPRISRDEKRRADALDATVFDGMFGPEAMAELLRPHLAPALLVAEADQDQPLAAALRARFGGAVLIDQATDNAGVMKRLNERGHDAVVTAFDAAPGPNGLQIAIALRKAGNFHTAFGIVTGKPDVVGEGKAAYRYETFRAPADPDAVVAWLKVALATP